MGRSKRLIPAIHVRDVEQARRNCQRAFDTGCDGVFLLNHENENGDRDLRFSDLLQIQAQIAVQLPGRWIGVNCLDLPAAEVFQHLTPAVSGLWVDDAEIYEREADQVAANAILQAKTSSRWAGEYFGGVAFKYQRPVLDPAKAAQIATTFVDVVATSGRATGEAASVEKIIGMKQAIPGTPLAIASGISADNVGQFLPWVDVFIVATGISRDFYELDQEKVARLAKLIGDYQQ